MGTWYISTALNLVLNLVLFFALLDMSPRRRIIFLDKHNPGCKQLIKLVFRVPAIDKLQIAKKVNIYWRRISAVQYELIALI